MTSAEQLRDSGPRCKHCGKHRMWHVVLTAACLFVSRITGKMEKYEE